MMFRFFTLLLCLFLFSGCTKHTGTSKQTITIVSSPFPHAVILKHIQPDMEKAGFCLKIIEVDDYKIPNRLLISGKIDANFFQHIAYFENECFELSCRDLMILTPVHLEPLGVYSKKRTTLDLSSPEALVIAVPVDVTNEKRALDLLVDLKIIEYKANVDKKTYLTAKDVLGIGRQVTIIEMPSPMLVRSLDEVDYAVIPSNFALDAELNPLGFERGEHSRYVNVVVIRRADYNKPGMHELKQCLSSPETAAFIEKEFSGALQAYDSSRS